MVLLTCDPIDRGRFLQGFSTEESGALVIFEGIVRGRSRGRTVTELYYEAFPQMALQEMEKINAEAAKRWAVRTITVVHRTGVVPVGETSVLVAVACVHRGDAFDACRFVIDSLKTTVPIWKREHYEDGAVWVEAHP